MDGKFGASELILAALGMLLVVDMRFGALASVVSERASGLSLCFLQNVLGFVP